ncbi:hypothetical protein CSV74_16090, partial [Sporosarcina sp. P19]
KEVYELPYTRRNEGACCGRRSEETETGELPVCGSSREPSTSAVVGTMNLPLRLPAKPQPPGRTGKRKARARTTTARRLLGVLNRNVIHGHLRTNYFINNYVNWPTHDATKAPAVAHRESHPPAPKWVQ